MVFDYSGSVSLSQFWENYIFLGFHPNFQICLFFHGILLFNSKDYSVPTLCRPCSRRDINEQTKDKKITASWSLHSS